MHTLTLNKNHKKPSASLHSTFNRHRRKVEQLRSQLEMLKKECEEALALYHSDLKPKEKEVGELVIQFIFRIKELTQKPKALNAKERRIFQELLKADIRLVFSLLPLSDIPDELKGIYKEIFGRSCDEEFREELSDLEEILKEHSGLSDIDLSDLNPDDSPEEMLRKLMGSINVNASENEGLPPPPPKQKSKKELLKEKKARDLEILQNKSLNSIYKRLVKELHPDLEQDSEKRAEKGVLMKHLTVAYENQDLFSLLTLELEWLGSVDYASETLSEESLKAYNSLLKDQIEDLKQELVIVPLHPRYIQIHRYLQDFSEKPLESINDVLSECDSLTDQYSCRLDDLSGKDPLKSLKEALAYLEREKLKEELQEELQDDFFDFLNSL